MGFGDRSGFACPRGPAGTRTAAIATQEMRSVLQRPEAGSTDVTFQAGATITEVMAFANANSLTLPLGTLPGYSDLTLGGLLSTGGHGQGPPGSSTVVSAGADTAVNALPKASAKERSLTSLAAAANRAVLCCVLMLCAQADMVTAITFVDGKGLVRTVARSSDIGRALSGGLGTLGIITEVTLRLQKGLRTTQTFAIGPKPDTGIAAELCSMIDRYSGRFFAYWRPDLGRVKYQVFQELPSGTASGPAEALESTARGGFFKPDDEG